MLAEKTDVQRVVDDIRDFQWAKLTRAELLAVAQAYYYFSVQFCENTDIAVRMYPDDQQLAELRLGECDTDNLSPYPGLLLDGEKANHDEYMRRVITLSSLPWEEKLRVDRLGARYLAEVRQIDPKVRAMSLPSYEDGGLETVFRAVLAAPDWDEPALAAFHHFLVGHIKLDSDPDHGHGSLCRHLVADDRVLPLWQGFRDLLAEAAPVLVA